MDIEGVKDDGGKPLTGTMLSDFAQALNAVAHVTTYGANLYGKSNWLHVENGIERYNEALGRHLLSKGYKKYNESGYLEMIHVAWNALAVLELMLRDGEEIKEK